MSRSVPRRATVNLALIIFAAAAICLVLIPRVLGFELFPVRVEEFPASFADVKRSGSPNDFLMTPPDFPHLAPDKASPVFDVPVDRLRTEWQFLMEKLPRIEVGRKGPSDELLLIQRSKVFRFPDLILVQFIVISEKQASLAIYSRSLYGYSDLGVNRDRVENWVTLLESQLAGTPGDQEKGTEASEL